MIISGYEYLWSHSSCMLHGIPYICWNTICDELTLEIVCVVLPYFRMTLGTELLLRTIFNYWSPLCAYIISSYDWQSKLLFFLLNYRMEYDFNNVNCCLVLGVWFQYCADFKLFEVYDGLQYVLLRPVSQRSPNFLDLFWSP